MHASTMVDTGFWDRAAQKYSQQPVPDEEAYHLTLERVRAHLGVDDRVLEVGCGTGTTALSLAESTGDILATDLSPRMIEIALAKAVREEVTNVRFTPGTLDDAALVPASFDVVMTFNLVHLLVDVPASLRRIHELVKPGGSFISKTPCIGEYGFFVRRLMIPTLHALGLAPFVNEMTKDVLLASLRDAGFEIVETGLYPAKRHSLFIVAKKAQGWPAARRNGVGPVGVAL